MKDFCENLILIIEITGSDKETLKFLESYHINISKLLGSFKMKECLEALIIYDNEHKSIYESYMKN